MKPPPRNAAIEVQTRLRSVAALALVRKIRRWARAFIEKMRLDDVALSVAVVRDLEIRALNRTWRRKDKATDVLSFPAGISPGPGPRLLGDIAISLPTAVRMARELGTSVDAEVRLYLAHGLLHLLGYDHHGDSEAQLMAEHERLLLGEEGMLERSAPAHRDRRRAKSTR